MLLVYFDAIHYKIRSDGKVQTRSAYTCLCIDVQWQRDLLGIWIGESVRRIPSGKEHISGCRC
ncbi:MAG: transposase [Candidatus Marinimicrobia bacterium]|nr:transposase [Candidatus Neomarinimicrobiota bacterium]MBO8131950.1 transposase [Candidatus Neomarinimicrobiota bacterium]